MKLYFIKLSILWKNLGFTGTKESTQDTGTSSIVSKRGEYNPHSHFTSRTGEESE